MITYLVTEVRKDQLKFIKCLEEQYRSEYKNNERKEL